MKIGIDLSVLQSDHKFRGIGSVIINFINNLESKDKKEHTFVFFVETKNENQAYDQLRLDNVRYEVRYLHNKDFVMLPGKLSLISKLFYKALGYIQYITGDPRISKNELKDIDPRGVTL